MGIVVASKTKLECDGDGCNESSKYDHDQTVAVNNAYDAGWIKSSTNGNVLCPKCRRSQTQLKNKF